MQGMEAEDLGLFQRGHHESLQQGNDEVAKALDP